MRKLLALIALSISAIVVAEGLLVSQAGALEAPSTWVLGGDCQWGGTRSSITWTIRNNDAKPGRLLAYLQDVQWSMSPPGSMSRPEWDGQELLSDGQDTISAVTTVPPTWSGRVMLSYKLAWHEDGQRKLRSGWVSKRLKACG